MADSTLAARLRIAGGSSVWVSDAARVPLLGPLPADTRLVAGPAEADVAVAFTADAAAVRALLAEHAAALAAIAVVWVAYPKDNAADINRDSLWPMLAEHGFRPVGQVAVDGTWSALRFRPLKPGESQFTGGRQAG